MAKFSDSSSHPWPFAHDIRFFDVLDSTNDRAAELIRDGTAELPLLVVAHRQTRGRGRGDHQWWSDTGSLTFTVALDPRAHGLPLECEYKLGLAAAVAVVDSLVELGLSEPTLGIRWPNDLEIDGRKFGGILPERIDTETRRSLIIGIGVNVFTDFTTAPTEVERMATSLAIRHPERSLGEPFVNVLLSAILKRLESVVVQLATGNSDLTERWNHLDLLRDKLLRVDLGSRIIEGRGVGIDSEGALLLLVDAGEKRHRILGGQVLR